MYMYMYVYMYVYVCVCTCEGTFPLHITSSSYAELNSSSPQQQWKTGKRKAEKDELVGGMFFCTMEHPEVHMERDTG